MIRSPRSRNALRSAFGWIRRTLQSARGLTRRSTQGRTPVPIAWDAFDRLQIISTGRTSAGIGGEHRSRFQSPSPDFVDYRPYQHGDDIRRIDWNVYGRLGTLQLRQTEALERLHVILLLDCSASMHWGEPNKLRFAGDLTAALARVALARSDLVTVQTLGRAPSAIGPLGGLRQFAGIHRFISEREPQGNVDLTQIVPDVFKSAKRVRGSRSLTVLISDLLNVSDTPKLLDQIANSGGAVLLHVLSREEAEPEALGDVDLVDAETGQLIEVGLSVETVATYQARFEAWRDSIQRECLARHIRYVECSSERPIQEVMLADLRVGQVLR